MTPSPTPRIRKRNPRSTQRGLLHACGVILAGLALTVSLLTAAHSHHDGPVTPVSCMICQVAEGASATPSPQLDLAVLPPTATAASEWPTTLAPVMRLETPGEARAPPA